jgi:hypothetical protein
MKRNLKKISSIHYLHQLSRCFLFFSAAYTLIMGTVLFLRLLSAPPDGNIWQVGMSNCFMLFNLCIWVGAFSFYSLTKRHGSLQPAPGRVSKQSPKHPTANLGETLVN